MTDLPPDFDPAYYNAVDQIFHSQWATQKLARLTLMRRWIEQLWPHGHPTRFIHIAGTSGKGSTTRLLEAALSTLAPAGGYYSPHLFDYRERFSLNGQFAPRADITAAWEQVVRPLCIDIHLATPHLIPAFPEITLLIALVLYERHGIEWAAIETGLGGRYDQTCALNVAATLLTNVGNDHEHLLGEHLWQRVLDKAGIARPGVPFFTTVTGAESLAFVRGVCTHVGAPLHTVSDEQVQHLTAELTATLSPIANDHPLLNTRYQHRNAALAFATLRHLFPTLPPAQILTAFASARLPGRFWEVGPHIYADVAHNPDKIATLADQVRHNLPAEQSKYFVIGVSGHRPPLTMLAPLLPLAQAIIITSGFYRAQPLADLQAALAQPAAQATLGEIPLHFVATPAEALTLAQRLRGPADAIILTGSTFLIEQALGADPYLRHINLTYGWRDKPPNQRRS